jgi:DNA-binding CsgD family transcriptional regulator
MSMFEAVSSQPVSSSIAQHAKPLRYNGPERRTASQALGRFVPDMLDEIDYGMLLVSGEAQVQYLNHAARLELDAQHPLQLRDHDLCALRPQDRAPLLDALAAAQRGLRRLLTLGSGDNRVCVSVLPLQPGVGKRLQDRQPHVLLVLGKRQVCARLTVEAFARLTRLTPAETEVLVLLCAGERPTRIAQQQQVQVCTVRTQIGAIRAKTGAAGISDLVRQVALLPPMLSVLRGTAAHDR